MVWQKGSISRWAPGCGLWEPGGPISDAANAALGGIR
jgi:hypothetical protein